GADRPLAPLPAPACRARMETGRPAPDPGDETCDPGMTLQRLDTCIVARKLALGEGGMDRLVADLVKEDRRPALSALELRDEVMKACRRTGRNRALAKRTDRRLVIHGNNFGFRTRLDESSRAHPRTGDRRRPRRADRRRNAGFRGSCRDGCRGE